MATQGYSTVDVCNFIKQDIFTLTTLYFTEEILWPTHLGKVRGADTWLEARVSSCSAPSSQPAAMYASQ